MWKKQGHSFIADENAQCKPLWKTVWQFLTKLNILLPFNPSITLNQKELKTWVHTKICTLITVLFSIANVWNQTRCSSVKKINCGIKRNDILFSAGKK